MKLFSEFVNESLNTPYEYWADPKEANKVNYDYVYTFDAGKTRMSVGFDRTYEVKKYVSVSLGDDYIYRIDFWDRDVTDTLDIDNWTDDDTKKAGDLTKKGNEFRKFATIKEITKKFIRSNNIGGLSVFGGNKHRLKLYFGITKSELPKNWEKHADYDRAAKMHGALFLHNKLNPKTDLYNTYGYYKHGVR